MAATASVIGGMAFTLAATWLTPDNTRDGRIYNEMPARSSSDCSMAVAIKQAEAAANPDPERRNPIYYCIPEPQAPRIVPPQGQRQ